MDENGNNGEEEQLQTTLGDPLHHVSFKVKGQDGQETFFTMKKKTQLKKLMVSYCERQSLDLNTISFLFDGRRLRGDQIPEEVGLEDGDEIDAMLHQTGGWYWKLDAFNASSNVISELIE